MWHNDGYYVLVMANFQRLLIVCISCEHPFFLISLWTLPEADSKKITFMSAKILLFGYMYKIHLKETMSHTTDTGCTCGGGCIIFDTHMILAEHKTEPKKIKSEMHVISVQMLRIVRFQTTDKLQPQTGFATLKVYK